jgi:hypothetical protein
LAGSSPLGSRGSSWWCCPLVRRCIALPCGGVDEVERRRSDGFPVLSTMSAGGSPSTRSAPWCWSSHLHGGCEDHNRRASCPDPSRLSSVLWCIRHSCGMRCALMPNAAVLASRLLCGVGSRRTPVGRGARVAHQQNSPRAHVGAPKFVIGALIASTVDIESWVSTAVFAGLAAAEPGSQVSTLGAAAGNRRRSGSVPATAPRVTLESLRRAAWTVA